MNKKRVIFWVKLALLLAVLGYMGRVVDNAWVAWRVAANQPANAQLHLSFATIDWRFGILAVAGFCGVMLTSAFTWRFIAWRMGDRSPTGRMIGAYTFSQMGKYVPGKVALLLMRIDRAGRFGMTAEVCTLSTLLENALYMISGGMVGMLAIPHVVGELSPRVQPFVWPVAIAAVVGLALACQPAVFYGVVGIVLRKMKRPAIAAEHRLSAGMLGLCVVAFVPCWVCGGFALWASASCLHAIPIGDSLWFAGAFSLSVIIGMASLLPGGTGVREAVLGAAVALQLSPVIGHNGAVLVGTVAAILQRVFQLMAEVVLGVAGAVGTRKGIGGRG